MNQEYIEDHELLYRGISRIKKLRHLDYNNQPTLAIFLNEKGVSVDRDGNRLEIECLEKLRQTLNKNYGGAVVITACGCRSVNAYPHPCASRTNPYHAHICNSIDTHDYVIDDLKALRLLRLSRIIRED